MKKVNGVLISLCVVISLVGSVATGIILGASMKNGDFVDTAIGLSILIIIVVTPIVGLICYIVFKQIAKKTMKKLNATDFSAAGTFYAGTATLKIDVVHGRIAYVSTLNPSALQVISAAQLENISSDYMKGPFGGTNYVYFQFYYNSKKMRIPTFTSRQVYSMNSEAVMTAISKADTYAGLLRQAKVNAVAA